MDIMQCEAKRARASGRQAGLCRMECSSYLSTRELAVRGERGGHLLPCGPSTGQFIERFEM